MKRLPAYFLLAAAALPVAALAQTSGLQIYGRVNLSVNNVRVDGVGSNNTVSNDTSWLGFRGTEDLGGGLSAFFKAETLVAADSGATGGVLNLGNGATPPAPTPVGQFFNREIHVGLRGQQWGQVSLGTHWAPGIMVTARTDAFERGQMGGQFTLLQGPFARGYAIQFVNSLQYVTPSWGGFSGKLLLQAPENTFNRNRALGLDYNSQHLYVGLSYDETQANLLSAPLGVAPSARLKNLGLGASYNFGVAKVLGYVQRNSGDGLPDVDGYNLGVQVPVGSGQIRASYSRTTGAGRSANLLAVGYNHFLSKRTQVYVTAARLDNGATARFAMWPTLQEGAVPAAAGQDSRGMQVGILHYF